MKNEFVGPAKRYHEIGPERPQDMTYHARGGIFHRFEVPKPGASRDGGKDARYITRPDKTEERREAIHLHNIPGYAKAGETYREMRANLIDYAAQREEDEKRRGGPESRTHYKTILSFEDRISTEKAVAMGREYVERNFPQARAIIACHHDTEHKHLHLYIAARQLDGRKIHLGAAEWANLQRAWVEIYAREFGADKARDHWEKVAAKREARNQWRLYKEGRAPKPEWPKTGARTERGKSYGDKDRVRGRERRAEVRESPAGGGNRATDRAASAIERAAGITQQSTRTADQAVQHLSRASERAGRMVERSRGRGGDLNGRY